MPTEIDLKPTRIELTKARTQMEESEKRMQKVFEEFQKLSESESIKTRDDVLVAFGIVIGQIMHGLDEFKANREQMKKYIELLETRLKHYDKTIEI